MVVRYQVSGGTSRGNLVVLAGGVEAVVATASEQQCQLHDWMVRQYTFSISPAAQQPMPPSHPRGCKTSLTLCQQLATCGWRLPKPLLMFTQQQKMTNLQGALNSALEFLAVMPPKTVSGNVTSAQMRMMMTMVPKGRAAVER